MISVDTNLLARLLLRDDPERFRRALAVLSSHEEVFVPVTVLLELAWVLRVRDATQDEIAASLQGILDLPQVVAQHDEPVRKALGWVKRGMDVADAFHLVLGDRSEAFVTFDKSLARQASRLAINSPVRLA